MFTCPRSGCKLKEVPPDVSFDAEANEVLKECPRCHMGFWQSSAFPVIVAPLTGDHLHRLLDGTGIASVWFNPIDYSDIRRWGRDVIDIETSPDLLKKGLWATYFHRGMAVGLWCRRGVRAGHIYGVRDVRHPGLDDLAWVPGSDQLIARVTR